MKLKSMKIILVGMLLIPMFVLSSMMFAPNSVFAAACNPDKPTLSTGQECGKPAGTNNDLFGKTGIFTTIMNVILFTVGCNICADIYSRTVGNSTMKQIRKIL